MLHRPGRGPCASRMQGLHLNAAKSHLSRYSLGGCSCTKHLSACNHCCVSTCSWQQCQCLAPRVMFCPADSAAPYRSRPSLLSSACRMAPCSMELCNGVGRGDEVVWRRAYNGSDKRIAQQHPHNSSEQRSHKTEQHSNAPPTGCGSAAIAALQLLANFAAYHSTPPRFACQTEHRCCTWQQHGRSPQALAAPPLPAGPATTHLTRPRISCCCPALSNCCSSRRRFSASPRMLQRGQVGQRCGAL